MPPQVVRLAALALSLSVVLGVHATLAARAMPIFA
jgi:hypothetical protein